jgi:hypothetical protein
MRNGDWRKVVSLFAAATVIASAAERGIIADYASVIQEARVRADHHHHLDTPATIAKIRALHANTYFYLVHGQADWDDLRNEFLPAAAQAGLDVWLYFVPPSECPEPCALPFGIDYIRTAEESARLSLKFPNLKGLAIDDFSDNLKLYTPEYIGRLRDSARAINPKFQFYPLLYWRSMLPEFLDKYAPVMDGVIMAYRDEPTINTSRNTTLRAQLDAAESLLRARSKALILMIYCAPLGRIPIPPDVEYVRDSVAMGVSDVQSGKLAGVVTYKLSKSGLPLPAAENYARTGQGRATILASGTGIPAGSYGELSSRISVTSGAPLLRLWCTALYSKLPPGYFFLQILADDVLLWEQDVSGLESKSWKQESIPLGDRLAGKHDATLRIRMALKRNTGSISVMLGVDDLEAEGFSLADPGFENPQQWTPAQTAPAFLPLVQWFDAQQPIRAFAAVSEVYGRATSR